MNFLKKNPFWLGCIIAVVALIAVYFVFVFPAESANREQSDQVDKLAGNMDSLARYVAARL